MDNPSHSLFDFGPAAASYDQWYETPQGQAHDKAQKEAVLKLLPRPQAGARLLDVGCGTGHWSRFFAEQGYEVFGLDASPEMVAVARSHHTPGSHFEVGDACRLPAGNRVYRVVAAMTTLEFVSDQAAAVAGMVRCLVPGGTVLIGTLNRLAPLSRERVGKGKTPYASAHLLSPAELRALLRPHRRVKMASANSHPERSGPSMLAAAWESLLLYNGRSAAPFIAAAVRPDVQEVNATRTGKHRLIIAGVLMLGATLTAGLLEEMGINSEATRLVRGQDCRACHAVKDIRYRPLAHRTGALNGIPSAIGIDINMRTAVFFFRYDLSTAWDDLPSDAMHIIGYEPDTARQLGANLMAYVKAERSAAIPLSQALLFVDADRSPGNWSSPRHATRFCGERGTTVYPCC